MSRLEAVTPSASRLLAPNPGPMTLDGTNTWVLRAPDDGGPVVVVDPGPLEDGHLDEVAALGPIAAVVLTHGRMGRRNHNIAVRVEQPLAPSAQRSLREFE